MPDRLDWLAQYGYERYRDGGDFETWICRNFSSRLDARISAELWVTATGDAEGRDFVELAAGLHDDNLCHVRATIDNIKTGDLRSRLDWYEERVLAMLELGLNVKDGARPTPRQKSPPCPSCGAELRTPLAQQCFACGADWHPRPPGGGAGKNMS